MLAWPEKLVNVAVKNHCENLVWHPFWPEYGDCWRLKEAKEFTLAEITNGFVFYRSWFAENVKANYYTFMTREPGDWNRYRCVKYFNPVAMRC
jgi:hypothetical protein